MKDPKDMTEASTRQRMVLSLLVHAGAEFLNGGPADGEGFPASYYDGEGFARRGPVDRELGWTWTERLADVRRRSTPPGGAK